jgi:hypothetical protein
VRWTDVVPAILIALVVSAPNASAQGLGVRGGATVNPDQFYVGGQYEMGPIEKLWFHPSVDFGFGDDVKLIAMNFDVVYRHLMSRRSPWTAFVGGGPSLNHYRVTGASETEFGVNVMGGMMHTSGIFFEARAGFADSPDFRFGVGYRFAPKPRTAVRRTTASRR